MPPGLPGDPAELEKQLDELWRHMTVRDKLRMIRYQRALNRMDPEERRFVQERFERFIHMTEVVGPVARDVGKRLREGITLDDGVVQADSFKLVSTVGNRVMVEVALHEGRKHVVRRMLAEVGHPVSRLVRTRVGPVTLGNLKPGKHRRLSQQEVGALYKSVGL
jgi:16S rRNA U516 pseudouridylate synthase RsuA-like enzyme